MHNNQNNILSTVIFIFLFLIGCKTTTEKKLETISGINERTPSKSNYFDWINSEWPGSNREKVMANLDFFEWLNKEYGMNLDIYHMDAGNIDRSPSWIPEATDYEEALTLAYGYIDDQRVREKFPDGFKSIVEKANSFNTRMGIWLGPDGYGTTDTEAEKRTSMLVNFCKDYNVALFKFDAACTNLNPENEGKFIKTMELCRSFTPDLITLNHRITLSDSAKKHMTTWLWEGKETYIDVHIWNEMPAPHHRAGALSRGLPPNLSRLTEDHGVCISSCLDYWEDDLILQAFNRNLILAPEIYGNPFLLRDDEFPKLARIYNLHKKYNDILVDGKILPEERYGLHAVSRGDASTRLITLRNLSWENVSYQIKLNEEIGIEGSKRVFVKQYHPTEKVIGEFNVGEEAKIQVDPFRSSLILVTADFDDEFSIEGTNYSVIKDVKGQPIEIELFGMPGKSNKIRMKKGSRNFKSAEIDGKLIKNLIGENEVEISFEGNPLQKDFHRKIADLKKVNVPKDAKSLYEATCFTADNNALEVRSAKRSGPTKIQQVQKARELFFTDSTFWKKGIWDKYAFDGNEETSFKVREYNLKNGQVEPGAFRINFGKPVEADKIVLKNVKDTFNVSTAQVSDNLKDWESVNISGTGNDRIIQLNSVQSVQFVRIGKAPLEINEIEVYANGRKIASDGNWQLSNLFPSPEEKSFRHCWSAEFELDEVAKDSYLCVTVPGNYGNEGAWAAVKVDGEYIGAPDRSPSFESNHWEHVVRAVDGNYTYYFPVNEDYTGKKIETFVLGFSEEMNDVKPEVWITAFPLPFVSKKLVLKQ